MKPARSDPETNQAARAMGLFGRIAWLVARTALVVGFGSALSTRGAGADPAILRVGVSANSPPMIFKQGDQIVGVEADLAAALAQELGRRVVFVQEKWQNLIDALNEDRFDIIMSSMSVTPARRYRVAFTNPYMKIGQIALSRAAEKYNYMINLADQAKRGVGVKPGTTADFLVGQEFPKLKRKYFKTGDAAAEALVNKKIDLFISDAPIIWYLAAHYEAKGLAVMPLLLSQEDLAWGVRRADTKLLDSANAFLQKAQASGELNRVLSRWMPGFR
jgi:polar amino acid transport system substrate-binding protein